MMNSICIINDNDNSSELIINSHICIVSTSENSHSYFSFDMHLVLNYMNNQLTDSSDKCDCNNTYVQSSAHLLTSCSKYQTQHSKIKEKLSISDNLSLKLLLTTREKIQAVFDFLKETEIARRNWLSE